MDYGPDRGRGVSLRLLEEGCLGEEGLSGRRRGQGISGRGDTMQRT